MLVVLAFHGGRGELRQPLRLGVSAVVATAIQDAG